jgi:hypothetical protein
VAPPGLRWRAVPWGKRQRTSSTSSGGSSSMGAGVDFKAHCRVRDGLGQAQRVQQVHARVCCGAAAASTAAAAAASAVSCYRRVWRGFTGCIGPGPQHYDA